jgi:hypothetical protein
MRAEKIDKRILLRQVASLKAMGAIPSERDDVAADHFARALDLADKTGNTLVEWMGLAANDQRLRTFLAKISRNVRAAHDEILRGVECSGLGSEVDARRAR